ncbi:uncharacterized protein LOC143146643 [Ptiloglossa arizonensis]|uniref:uncharacterized protein LOC143146643 n=1 Tax=Ptiloglossa arizonensis TaxID=3350558 RepID=UPI003FA06A80
MEARVTCLRQDLSYLLQRMKILSNTEDTVPVAYRVLCPPNCSPGLDSRHSGGAISKSLDTFCRAQYFTRIIWNKTCARLQENIQTKRALLLAPSQRQISRSAFLLLINLGKAESRRQNESPRRFEPPPRFIRFIRSACRRSSIVDRGIKLS